MKKRLVLLVAFLGFTAAAVDQGQAQVTIGPKLSLAEDVDIGIGALVGFSLDQVVDNLTGAASFDLYFPGNNVNYFQINGTAQYHISTSNADIDPYVLGGIAIGRISYDAVEINIPGVPNIDASSTEIGLIIGGGLGFEAGALNPFVEIHLGIGDIPSFALSGGLAFEVGG